MSFYFFKNAFDSQHGFNEAEINIQKLGLQQLGYKWRHMETMK